MELLEKDKLVGSVTVPELRSCIQRLLDTMSDSPEESKAHRLTLLALLGFYRKNMQATMDIETDHNTLKSRIIESGVLYFGPLFCAKPESEMSKARRLNVLNDLGFCTEHLVFLNTTQVELFYTYVRETGLIHNGL